MCSPVRNNPPPPNTLLQTTQRMKSAPRLECAYALQVLALEMESNNGLRGCSAGVLRAFESFRGLGRRGYGVEGAGC